MLCNDKKNYHHQVKRERENTNIFSSYLRKRVLILSILPQGWIENKSPMREKTLLEHILLSTPCLKTPKILSFTYRTSNTLLVHVLCLTLYDFGCLCFHCTRTSWATTRVTMRISTISACMASWPLCLACILACSTLWKKNILNSCYVAKEPAICLTYWDYHGRAIHNKPLVFLNGNGRTVWITWTFILRNH